MFSHLISLNSYHFSLYFFNSCLNESITLLSCFRNTESSGTQFHMHLYLWDRRSIATQGCLGTARRWHFVPARLGLMGGSPLDLLLVSWRFGWSWLHLVAAGHKTHVNSLITILLHQTSQKFCLVDKSLSFPYPINILLLRSALHFSAQKFRAEGKLHVPSNFLGGGMVYHNFVLWTCTSLSLSRNCGHILAHGTH